MKRNTKSISQLAVIALATGSLCAIATMNAQPPPGTAVSDNPRLRVEATPSSSAADPAKLGANDKDFISKAAAGGMMEIEMGEMAQKQGQSAEVKQIGKQIAADHTKANNELIEIAKKKGVGVGKLTTGMPKMDKAHFDQDYLAMMVRDHQTDIALFEKQVKSGSDADLKAYASKTLPVLKKHMAMVKQAQGKAK